MFGKTFYFGLIRKYVTLLGTLLNDIHIIRTDADGVEQLVKVPLTYAPRERMLARVTEDAQIDRPYSTLLPAISFQLNSLEYDPTRKESTTLKNFYKMDSNKGKLQYQYVPVPWNFRFSVSVFAKNVEDGNKIIEQILPYFTPHWSVSVKLIPEINVIRDIDIVLNNVDMQDTYAGSDKNNRRTISWELSFTVKGFLFGPTTSSAIIKFANVSLYIPITNTAAEGVGVTDPSVSITVQPGLTSNGQPTSNAQLTIPYQEIEATDDFGYIIEKSLLINE